MTIEKSIRHIAKAIGLALVHRGVGTHLFLIASALMLVDIGLPRH